MELRFPDANAMDEMAWPFRLLLGCLTAVISIGLTFFITPLRSFPLLVAFPTVIFSAWFFGMAGSFGCALLDVTLVDVLLTKEEFRFSVGFARQEERLALFLLVSTLVGVLVRRMAHQQAELRNTDLKRNLMLEVAQRQMAEERVRSAEALKEQEELLQIALRANGMGLWMWDLHADAMHRSDEVYRIAGMEPGEISSDPRAWLQCVHPDDREGLEQALLRTRDTGCDYHFQYRVCWSDGSVHWLESQGKAQRDSDGRITRIAGVLADVTHRKRSEEAMLRAEKLAVAGRLAASVAHEINNPLEAVANLLYLISLTDNTAEAHKHAQRALDELLRVSLITQSTLKFHRQPGTPRVTMLSEVMEGVLAMFRGRLHSAGIQVKLNMEEEVAVACMPSEMQQIFSNLIANAIEAMPKSGRLVIRLQPSHDWRDRDKKGMRVTFGDTGMGMERAIMRRVYEPFFTTKAETGTGLGLWVVAQLVERHGGEIRLWSSLRQGASGTVFSLFLPTGIDADLQGVEVGTTTGRRLPGEQVALAPQANSFPSLSTK